MFSCCCYKSVCVLAVTRSSTPHLDINHRLISWCAMLRYIYFISQTQCSRYFLFNGDTVIAFAMYLTRNEKPFCIYKHNNYSESHVHYQCSIQTEQGELEYQNDWKPTQWNIARERRELTSYMSENPQHRLTANKYKLTGVQLNPEKWGVGSSLVSLGIWNSTLCGRHCPESYDNLMTILGTLYDLCRS